MARWGFALAVASALAVSVTLAVTVPVPTELPSLALNAVVVYRLQVGGALFVGLYIAVLFVVWQIINYAAFRSLPGLSVYVGGALVIAGGLIITFWPDTR